MPLLRIGFAVLVALSARALSLASEPGEPAPGPYFTDFDQPGATPGELQPSAPPAYVPQDDGQVAYERQGGAEHKFTGFIDLNYYWDEREFNTLTLNAGANLPHDIEYFQFANFDSRIGDAAELEDMAGFYTEIHFRRPIAKGNGWLAPLDWTLMFADGSAVRDVQRLGVRWRTHDTGGMLGHLISDVLKLEYSVNLHFLESDGSGIQLEHVYRRFFLDKHLYVAGFADHDINTDGTDDWVTEHQVGLRLFDEVFLVVEYRYNSHVPGEFKDGWGFGLEYLVAFK